MIDCTPDFLEQVEREKIDKIDFILFTQAHLDYTGGIPDLKKWLDKKDLAFIPIFAEPQIYSKIKSQFKVLSHLSVKYFQPTTSFIINDIKITPFRTNSDTCGFRFLDIVYSGAIDKIPKESLKYYDNTNILIFNTLNWFNSEDDYNVAKALQFAQQIKPTQFILTQAGDTYPVQGQAEAEINQYWKEIQGNDSTKISLAHDGLKLILREHISQVLYELKEAIYLAQPFASMIYSGEKDLIVKSKLFKNKVNKFIYLVEDNLCYGIIRLKYPNKINLEEFDKLQDRHQIKDAERIRWWPYKEVLYSYEFDIIKLFETPKRVDIPVGTQTFISDFKFLESENLIQDPKSYDPVKLTTEILRDDWRIVNAWYSTKKKGGKINHSIEEIINLAKMIYLELKARGTVFHPETMKPYSRELYNKVSDKSLSKDIDLTNPELLAEFDDKILIKNFISVVGSYVSGNKRPNDIDILIRMNEPTEYIKRAIEIRLLKDVSYSEDLHFIWGDPEGPHDSYVPLYDLQINRIKPLKIIKMFEEETELSAVMPFNPMKPKKRFYQVDELLNYMFKDSNKFALEKKFNGYRVILTKVGNTIKMYSSNKKDISKHFYTILAEAKDLSGGDLVIDAELVYGEGGRAEIAKYITGNEELDDSKLSLYAFDCLYNKQDLTKLPWHERKSILHSLNFSKHIKEVNSIIVSDRPSAEKAINFLRNLANSEGVMIKKYNGEYTKGKDSDVWIKFRNEDNITVKILKVNPKENGFSYLMGIKAPKNADPKYVQDDYLILGNTFVSDIKASEGEQLSVNIEEVWRHSYLKTKTFRYSVHKPRVMEKTNKPLTSWETLDKLAVSKGEEVIENKEEELEATPSATTTGTSGISDVAGRYLPKVRIPAAKKIKYKLESTEELEECIEYSLEDKELQLQEGGEQPSVKNFPERMQRNFKEIKDSEKWKDFVIQWHLRGEKSIHSDLRLEINDLLEGFTLFTPPSIDKPDLLTEDPHDIRGTIKVPQPKEWLKVEGGYKAGAPGATSKYNTYFAIVGKGKYRPIEIEDHKIVFELKSDSGKIKQIKSISKDDDKVVEAFNKKLPDNLKNLNGCFSYHIAHIGDKHIILFDKLKECPGGS